MQLQPAHMGEELCSLSQLTLHEGRMGQCVCALYMNLRVLAWLCLVSAFTYACRRAMWVCHVGVPCGCVMWVCHVGVSCGCVVWVCHVGVPCGCHVGVSCGCVMWVCHVGVSCRRANSKYSSVCLLCVLRRSCWVCHCPPSTPGPCGPWSR